MSISAGGTGADINARWDEYITRFCRRDENNGVSGCAADQPYAGQDVDVTGTIFSKETIDVRDPEIKRNMDDLILNIAEPFIKDPAPRKTFNAAEGQRSILESEAYKARRQVIYDALYHVVSRRVPGSMQTGDPPANNFVRPLRLAAGVDPAMLSDNPSQNEIMQTMMSERFRSSE